MENTAPDTCTKCGGTGQVRVKHGTTFETDSAAEIANAYHSESCPDCHGLLPTMTAKQERHLNDIKDKLEHLVDLKYRRGALEHGGDLQDMNKHDLVDNIIAEILDLAVYVLTLKAKL